jgi:hypothetical protein
MPACDLFLKLDRPEHEFLAGEKITGEARVEPHEDFECQAIRLDRLWRAEGQGNSTHSIAVPTKLSGPRQLRAGEPLRFRYELDAPALPETYHGHLFQVDWILRLQIDLPKAIDPKTEESFSIRRAAAGGHETEPFASIYGLKPEQEQAKDAFLRGLGPVADFVHFVKKTVPTILAAVLLFFGSIGLAMTSGPTGGNSLKDGAIALGLLLGGLVLLFRTWRDSLSQQMLLAVEFEIENDRLRRGERARLSLDLVPWARLTPRAVRCALLCHEEINIGTGERRRRKLHLVSERRLEQSFRELDFTASGRGVSFEFEIPEDAPLSFYSSDHSLIWSLELLIDLPFWIDWRRQLQIHVRR